MSGLYPVAKIFSCSSVMTVAPPEDDDLYEPSVLIIISFPFVTHSQRSAGFIIVKFSMFIFSYSGKFVRIVHMFSGLVVLYFGSLNSIGIYMCSV